MKLSIEVTKEDLMQAAENLVYTQSLDQDTEADEMAIALVIKEHLEKAIEEILSNPEKYLTPNEWQQINKCFVMNYSAYIKMRTRIPRFPRNREMSVMNRDIPYPL